MLPRFSASADGFQIEEISTELCAVVQASTRMPGSTAGAAASIQCPEALSGGFPPGTLLPISVLWHLPQYGVRFAGTKASNSAQIAQLLGEAGIPDAYVLPFSAYLQHAEKTCPAYESVSELTMADIQQRQANLLATPVDDKVVWSIACALLAKRWTKAILRSSTVRSHISNCWCQLCHNIKLFQTPYGIVNNSLVAPEHRGLGRL
eukprot:SAG31_NODE_1013_length_10376_cov_9.342220_3_plen_206_part_00